MKSKAAWTAVTYAPAVVLTGALAIWNPLDLPWLCFLLLGVVLGVLFGFVSPFLDRLEND